MILVSHKLHAPLRVGPTNIAIIGKYGLHLMDSMLPKNDCRRDER